MGAKSLVGQQYDQNGERRQWWSNQSLIAFKEKLKCFVDQYNNYTFLGIPVSGLKIQYISAAHMYICTLRCLVQVNGNGTLAENVADNGGIETAFEVSFWSEAGQQAYNIYVSMHA